MTAPATSPRAVPPPAATPPAAAAIVGRDTLQPARASFSGPTPLAAATQQPQEEQQQQQQQQQAEEEEEGDDDYLLELLGVSQPASTLPLKAPARAAWDGSALSSSSPAAAADSWGSSWGTAAAVPPPAAEQPLPAEAWPAPGQTGEDAELQAAIQASLADAAASMQATHQLNRSAGARASEAAAAEPTGSELGLAGLCNERGEYNCFLNVIIQCLWRCADFRQQVCLRGASACLQHALHGARDACSVLCSVHVLTATCLFARCAFLFSARAPRTHPFCESALACARRWRPGMPPTAAPTLLLAACTPCSSSCSSRRSSGAAAAAAALCHQWTPPRCARRWRACPASSSASVSLQPLQWRLHGSCCFRLFAGGVQCVGACAVVQACTCACFPLRRRNERRVRAAAVDLRAGEDLCGACRLVCHW